jgi:hypothetical protein
VRIKWFRVLVHALEDKSAANPQLSGRFGNDRPNLKSITR